jgi:hypothetical protein
MGVDERNQGVESASAELDWSVIGKQFTAMTQDFETAELDNR